MIESFGFKCFPALCALEAKPPVEWDKGRAAIYILRTAFGVDWSERIRIVFAGDDVGDEDAIVALKGLIKKNKSSYTFFVFLVLILLRRWPIKRARACGISPALSLFFPNFLFLLNWVVKRAGIGATFRVTSDMDIETAADRRLPNTDVVLALLKWIERFMIHRKPRFCVTATTNLVPTVVPHADPMESDIQIGV